MCRTLYQARIELLEIAKTCTGDCENCGAIGYELDRWISDGEASRSGINRNANCKPVRSGPLGINSLELE